jgi:hypothetical protein
MSEAMGLALVLVILLVLSAWDATSKAAIWAGIFLLFVVWFSCYQTGQLKSLGQELFSTGGT